jgi:hypothetical protein
MPWLLVAALAFDLSAARTEPNLEKRSDLALKNADAAVTALRDAAPKGDDAKLASGLAEVRESVDFSYQSLKDSRTDPRRSRYFKSAELATRQLARRLESLVRDSSAVDQEAIQPLQRYVTEVHDKLLDDIMARKKK